MMGLKFYNSLTRQLEPFEPRQPGHVSLYVCGPTVYDDPHLGHARCYITWDVLVRLLRALDYHVTYARNITDVDDKILNRAQERGVSPQDLARQYEARFHEAMTALNVLPADVSPHATEHIPQMIEGIQRLMAQGFAYATSSGDVYFDIAAYNAAFGNCYPALSRQSLDQKQAGARVEQNPDKKNPHDFALWKIASQTEPDNTLSWPAPWTSNLGRPGWHIECSAMNAAVFGPQIDIHAGGADLMFPHHDCEIAQSQAWHGAAGTPFAKLWLHNGFVNVSGEKMSKSLNNFKTVFDVLNRYSANAIRYFLLQHHYRSPVDFSDEPLIAAQKRITKIQLALEPVFNNEILRKSPLAQEVLACLCDDMNTPKALAIMNQNYDKLLKHNNEDMYEDYEFSDVFTYVWQHILGFKVGVQLVELSTPAKEFYFTNAGKIESMAETHGLSFVRFDSTEERIDQSEKLILDLIQQRLEAKTKRDWALSDKIRDDLAAIGIQLKDNKDGTTTYEAI